MDKRKEVEKAAENVKEGIKHSAEDLKETASDKIEGFLTAAEKQGEKLSERVRRRVVSSARLATPRYPANPGEPCASGSDCVCGRCGRRAVNSQII